MSNDPPRRVFIGTLPAGYDDVFVDGADPFAAMIAEGNAALDAARASEEKARLSAIADAGRLRNTRRARTRRRLARALTMLMRLR
jgi:hypothetical protein